jgi:hypothetical protein
MAEIQLGKVWINGKLVYYPDYISDLKKKYKSKKIKKKNTNDGRITHGMASSKKGIAPTYQAWQSIKNTNIRRKRLGKTMYHIHEAWLDEKNGFMNFLGDLGKKPSENHSLKRIARRNGYLPENCKWVEDVKIMAKCISCENLFQRWSNPKKEEKYCSQDCKRRKSSYGKINPC